MATLDLTNAVDGVDMTDLDLVRFGASEATAPDFWNYWTPSGHWLRLDGAGFTYGEGYKAVTGSVDEISIDVGGNALTPDVSITGFTAKATKLAEGPLSFWRVMEGDDVIYGPDIAGAPGAGFRLFGDGLASRAGQGSGGDDTFFLGGRSGTAFGDVVRVGAVGGGVHDYRGGEDTLTGALTAEAQTFVGDADVVGASGRLTGGDDLIVTGSSSSGRAVGDAVSVGGAAGALAVLVGGADFISAGAVAIGQLYGDALSQTGFSEVRGGGDWLSGGDLEDTLVGDVANATGGRTFGGADTLNGFDGADLITGDVFNHGGDSVLKGGADLVYGGMGDDRIFGDVINESATVEARGGDDQLYGEEGDDRIYGQGGDDTLHGGLGGDTMDGGRGDDLFVVDDQDDLVLEAEGQGLDLVRSAYSNVTLAANVENLTYIGDADFAGFGNALGNVMQGGGFGDLLYGDGGDDRLVGGDGDDFLAGGSGSDVILGGAGKDTMIGGELQKMVGDGGFGPTVDGERDVFVFRALSDSRKGTPDAILGLEEMDVIDLRAIDARADKDGNQAFRIVEAFSGKAGEMTLSFDDTTYDTTVAMDVDGDGKADMAIMLDDLGTQADMSGFDNFVL